jgi:hypothetical protein
VFQLHGQVVHEKNRFVRNVGNYPPNDTPSHRLQHCHHRKYRKFKSSMEPRSSLPYSEETKAQVGPCLKQLTHAIYFVIHFNIIIWSSFQFPKWSPFKVFPTKTLHTFLISPVHIHTYIYIFFRAAIHHSQCKVEQAICFGFNKPL